MSKANLQSLGRHHDDEDLFGGEGDYSSSDSSVEQIVEWSETVDHDDLGRIAKILICPDAAGRWIGSAASKNTEVVGQVKLKADKKEETIFEVRLANDKSTLVILRYFSVDKLYRESVLGRQQESEFSYLPVISKIYEKLGAAAEFQVIAVTSVSFADLNVGVGVGKMHYIATECGSDILPIPGLDQMPEGNPISGFSGSLINFCEAKQVKAKVVVVIRESSPDYATFKVVERLFPHVSRFLNFELELPSSAVYRRNGEGLTNNVASSLLYT